MPQWLVCATGGPQDRPRHRRPPDRAGRPGAWIGDVDANAVAATAADLGVTGHPLDVTDPASDDGPQANRYRSETRSPVSDGHAVSMTRTTTALVAVFFATIALATPAHAAPRTGTFGKHASWHGIRIGMTLKQAKATKKLKPGKFTGPCMYTSFKKYPAPQGVMISRKIGVAVIGAPSTARTPRGIGVGSTAKQVRKAYPTYKAHIDFSIAKVPGYKHVEYGFQLGKDDKVVYMWVMTDRQDCAN
jgi:hypothetical protein